jgi:predicted alpha/beta-hydrolase family hydrolase
LPELVVERFDFPYRREGRRAPDRANKLIASLRADVDALCERLGTSPEHVVLGGRSMGGRMCSMAVAGATGATAKGAPTHEDPLPAAGLVLLGYPLHPPGRPDRLRTEHLPDVEVPTLFVSGDRDPFGTPEELAAARALVAGPVTELTVEGARHELKGVDELVVATLRDWLGLSG